MDAMSILLARMFALYLLTTGIIMLADRKRYQTIVIGLIESPPVMFVLGIMTLILGCILVVLHNVWVSSWEIAVTLVAWTTFVKGVAVFVFPRYFQEWGHWILNTTFYYFSVAFALLLGLFLGYCSLPGSI